MNWKSRALALLLLVGLNGCSGGVSLPEDFPTVAELEGLSSPWVHPQRDARVESSMRVRGDLENIDPMFKEDAEWVITNWQDIVVWDYGSGYREVSKDGRMLFQAEDGTWQESDIFEWPMYGPDPDWFSVQVQAEGCLGSDPQELGAAEIAGVITKHIRCGDGSNGVDLWLDESGLVMKKTVLATYTESLRVEWEWVVTDLDHYPGEPLP